MAPFDLSGQRTLSIGGASGMCARAVLHGMIGRRGAPHNVLVNGVALGVTQTPMTDGQSANLAAIQHGRLATAEEIAAPIAFLLSPAASYVRGLMLDVNGGVYMG
jgi:NAD(P)-dependent dehydrogenase (short-subunit alcohol dehydrogenase family)